MPTRPYTPNWIAPAVRNFMHVNDIRSRGELARWITRTGQSVARSTVYAVFNEEWEGVPSLGFLGVLALASNTPLARLVAQLVEDPVAKGREQRKGGRVA